MSEAFINDDANLNRPVLAYDWAQYHGTVNPEKTAIIDLDSGNSFSYYEFNVRASQLANHFRHDCQIKKGDRIAILAKNGNEFLEFYYACNKIGAISVLLNWRLSVPELEYIVGDSAPRVIIYGDDFQQQLDGLSDLYSFQYKLLIDRGAQTNPYEDAIARQATQFIPASDTSIRLMDVQTIMYTSGTTGKPKGAMITYNMTFINAINLGTPFLVTPNTVNLVVLPLFHTGGLNCYANPTVHAGGTNVIMREFDPAEGLRIMTDPELGITHLLGVPSVYQFMDQLPEFVDAQFPTIITAGVGGAPVPLATLNKWVKKGLPLKQGFGMTETSPSCLFLGGDKAIEKIGSVGLPVLHNEVRIVDDRGDDVEQGKIGELWVKGPNVCPGYWNNPEANESSFTDGWLHTGDASRQDEDGYYYIVDRWKDMYISGGENVYPAEIEAVLYELEDIAEAAVIGVADEKWGEVGKIYAVAKPGATLRESEVLGYCAQKLAKFKIPRSMVVIHELPRNATGKVLKRNLR